MASASLNALLEVFSEPPRSARPTPLYWWSGSDIDRDRLRSQLTELAGKGIGGTIVGYSHLPDGDLDHGSPTPLSDDWWELLRWFTEESAKLGMTVGIQDYGLNGPILRAAGAETQDLQCGTLQHIAERRTGPGNFVASIDGQSLVAAIRRDSTGAAEPLESSLDNGRVRYSLPEGEWEVSLVCKRTGAIGSYESSFDPMHPRAGQLLIQTFYQRFSDNLQEHFGSTFTTFFQDELDFGLRMPLWNDLVAGRLVELYGFDHRRWLPALWVDLGPRTLAFRAAYRDVVIGLLEDHYFRPIFDWHQSHGTSMFMDQVSRGDLRSGRHAYGDYMQTMRWYNGPGNDDPDLTTPRSVAAFKVSASIARLNNRPIVASEAFHSSGWGISPEQILGGLNAGFAYGVNHVIMHGLNYSTEGGWWEWASPDFHFRQPWWEHSDSLWTYITRISALLRCGKGIADVAVLDPTQDLDLIGDTATSPECAIQVLSALAQAGHDCDLVDPAHLGQAEISDQQLLIGDCAYRALVVPDLRAARADVLKVIQQFADKDGIVIVLGQPPTLTESELSFPQNWSSALKLQATAIADLPDLLATLWEPDFDARGSGLVAAHRSHGTTDLYFIANVTEQRVQASVDLRALGQIQVFDAWSGTIRPGSCEPAPGKKHSTRVVLDLAPGLATVLVLDSTGPASDRPTCVEPSETVDLEGPWQLQAVAVLDNSHGDFEYGAQPLGVETWHVDTSQTAEGPWTPAIVRDGAKFLALGPIPAELANEVEAAIRLSTPLTGQAVEVGGADIAWRPYAFSIQTGVADDPLLLDRMTGPHGLKYVPDEFLDPSVLDEDPPPGSLYYFWSTINVEDPALTVSAGSRAAYRLWLDDQVVLTQDDEVPPHRTPAWNLRDLTVMTESRTMSLPPGRRAALLRLAVSFGQPSRASLAIGREVPGDSPRPRLRWWHGDSPCLTFDASAWSSIETIWIKAAAPPGFQAAKVAIRGRLRSARLLTSTQPLEVRMQANGLTDLSLTDGLTVSSRDELLLEVEATVHGYQGAAVLDGPITWTLGDGTAPSARFTDHGLGDFSGIVRYRTDFDWASVSGTVLLSLPGLESSAKVHLNDQLIGSVLTPQQELDATPALRPGLNTIEVEVANTLVNRFSVLPSPFSHMQQPGGGFTAIRLRLIRPAAAG